MIKQIFWRGQVFLRLTLPLVTDQLLLDGVKQTTLQTSCLYIPPVQCECDHVTAPRQHQREKVQNLIKKIID